MAFKDTEFDKANMATYTYQLKAVTNSWNSQKNHKIMYWF